MTALPRTTSLLRRRVSWFARWVLGVTAAALMLVWLFTLIGTIRCVSTGRFMCLVVQGGIQACDDSPVQGDPRPASVVLGIPGGFSSGLHQGVRFRATLNHLIWRWSWSLPRRSQTGTTTWRLVIPLWIPFGVCAILSSVAWDRRLRQDLPGRCEHCGYDRTGLPRSAPCPECGG